MGSYAIHYAQAWSQSSDQTATGGLVPIVKVKQPFCQEPQDYEDRS